MSDIRHPNLESITGSRVVVETLEGSIIAGKLTSVEYQHVDLLGTTVSTPTVLVLNNDDQIYWSRVQRISKPKVG